MPALRIEAEKEFNTGIAGADGLGNYIEYAAAMNVGSFRQVYIQFTHG